MAAVLLAGGTALSLLWLSHPYDDTTADGSLYLLTARSLLRGDGYSALGVPVTMRPPGFAVLLLAPLALFGLDFAALNATVGLLGVACVTLLMLHARPRLGLPLSFAVALAVWLQPGFRLLSTRILSDVPGMALVFACLLAERWARARPSWRRDAALGLLIAAAAYVRTLSLLLLPAILLSRAWLAPRRAPAAARRRGLARAALLAGIVLAALVPWAVRDALRRPPPPVEEFHLYSYSVAMLHEDPGDPASRALGWGELLARVPARTPLVLRTLGGWLPSAGLRSGDLALGLAALASLAVVAIRRREPAELFALGSFAVLVVYFGWGERLVLPIYLLALPALVEAALGLLRRAGAGRAAPAVLAALVLALAAAEFRPPDTDGIARRQTALLEVGRFLEAHVPPGAALAATSGRHLSLYLDRPVWSLKHAEKRRGLGRVQEILDERRVAAVVVDREYRRSPLLLAYLAARYPVLADFGRYVVFDTGVPPAPGAGALLREDGPGLVDGVTLEDALRDVGVAGGQLAGLRQALGLEHDEAPDRAARLVEQRPRMAHAPRRRELPQPLQVRRAVPPA